MYTYCVCLLLCLSTFAQDTDRKYKMFWFRIFDFQVFFSYTTKTYTNTSYHIT